MSFPTEFDDSLGALQAITPASGWDSVLNDRLDDMSMIFRQSLRILGYRNAVDLDGEDSLYIVPTGYAALVVAVVLDNASFSMSATGVMNFGGNATSYNDFVASVSIDLEVNDAVFITPAKQYGWASSSGQYLAPEALIRYAAGTTFKSKETSGSWPTVDTYVIGFEVPV